ncbi:hypothetical protein VKT23_010651 [Stygiomarasmius scandens]|uniref:Uncharacterized protein n=1 Tax=Marasmiellus scandens TaxID=2682957 RepID=A0ABR1JAW1_9AGAR
MIVPSLQSSEGVADDEEQYEGGVGDIEELADEVNQGQYIAENEVEVGDLDSENNVDFEERVDRVVTEIAMLQAGVECQEADEDFAIARDRDGIAESNGMEDTDNTQAEADNIGVEEDEYEDLRMLVDAVWDDEHEDPKGDFGADAAEKDGHGTHALATVHNIDEDEVEVGPVYKKQKLAL